MFVKIGAVVLFVQDLETCAAFYRDAFGLQVAFTDEVSVAFRMNDHDFALLKTDEARNMVGEAALGHGAEARHRMMLCADVEDVDASYEALIGKGVPFIKSPVDQPWGIRAAYLADPEGNLWELRHRFTPSTGNG